MAVLILDRLLEQLGFSVADVVRMSGLGRSTVDAIRRNGGGRRKNMEKIAMSLGLRYENLYMAITPEHMGEANDRPSLDNTELNDLAKMYFEEGNSEIHQRLRSAALKVGICVEALLDRADTLFIEGCRKEAVKEYSYAFSSAKPRHIERIRKSAAQFFKLCETEQNIQPVIDLYYKIKSPPFRDYELLIRMGTFFARNRQDAFLIIECFDIADTLVV